VFVVTCGRSTNGSNNDGRFRLFFNLKLIVEEITVVFTGIGQTVLILGFDYQTQLEEFFLRW
jgi:hypothetical protein